LPRPPFQGPADRTCGAGRRRRARMILSRPQIQACRRGKLCARASTPVASMGIK
jgi:hypothetical protein